MSGMAHAERNSTLRRIGHKGADHIAPGNTIASFDAALEVGVDMIEFDVIAEHKDGSGRLLLAHDYKELAHREPLTLEEGLDHFCTDAYVDIELDVDMKLAGYERRVVDALRDRGLLQRTLISTMETSSLPLVRRFAPEVRLGWSVPKTRRNWLTHPLTRPAALAYLHYLRHKVARTTACAVREGRIDAVMAHWSLVTAGFLQTVATAGGDVYVWTVDDPGQIAAFEALGVAGVITNDPRLFG